MNGAMYSRSPLLAFVAALSTDKLCANIASGEKILLCALTIAVVQPVLLMRSIIE